MISYHGAFELNIGGEYKLVETEDVNARCVELAVMITIFGKEIWNFKASVKWFLSIILTWLIKVND